VSVCTRERESECVYKRERERDLGVGNIEIERRMLRHDIATRIEIEHPL